VGQEFLGDQHVEADGHEFFLAADDGAADLVLDADDFQEEVAGESQVGADFQQCPIERNMSHEAADMRLGAEVVADDDDAAGPVDDEILECALGMIDASRCGSRVQGHVVTLRFSSMGLHHSAGALKSRLENR